MTYEQIQQQLRNGATVHSLDLTKLSERQRKNILFRGYDKSRIAKFDAFVNYHKDVVETFFKEARKVAEVRQHYSSNCIIEFMRHHTLVTEGEEAAFKLDSSNTPLLGRYFIQKNPQHNGLFTFKRPR